MWSAVDQQDYLLATQSYMLSRHVHTSLQLEAQRSASILSWFPVLSRQWTAISHFKATILQVIHFVFVFISFYFFCIYDLEMKLILVWNL